jgi:hypothetical protein
LQSVAFSAALVVPQASFPPWKTTGYLAANPRELDEHKKRNPEQGTRKKVRDVCAGFDRERFG